MPIKQSIRTLSVLVVWTIAIASSARADGLIGLTPAEEAVGSIASVRDVLEPHANFDDVTAFAGIQPKHCQSTSNHTRICSWPLSKTEAGWQPLAEALDTGDRLTLVCELPGDAAPRSADSCSVHASRSNRRYYRSKMYVRDIRGRPSPALTAAKARLKVDAKEHLSAAQTPFQLSTLVGDAPSACVSQESGLRCTWNGTSATYGHGTLAMSIGADLADKVRLHCQFAADGAGRTPDACRVEVGG